MICQHCGAENEEKPASRRSAPHHRRFFGLIEAAFANWPEDAEFQPSNPEHLRAWLLCTVKRRKVKEVAIEFSEATKSITWVSAAALEAAIRDAGPYPFLRPHPRGGSVAVYSAESIAWHRLPQKDFTPIAEAVEGVIEQVLGVDGDTLLKGHEKAA